ncbi:MAG TPA: hypothetical protein VK457_25580 [Chloroflexota bacterium]|nr:hypothetical protein [Chloroflexota bacterium]
MAERAPLLDLSGPRTVKEAESLVFLAARSDPQLEAAHRTWLEEDRSYFIRWREKRDGAPLQIIGLVHAFQLPEMACRLSLIPFEDLPTPALRVYADRLRKELEAEGFA